MTSIIIPAHNEAKVIGRLLAPLALAARAREIELIVVANGCTDETADVARRIVPEARVIETPIASKSNALNLGDEAASGFPRIYVDADVELSIESIRELSRVLQDGTILAAAPAMRVNLDACPWSVRAFYRVWLRLPYCRAGMIGSGVYAISETGRKRWTTFPDITADDVFSRLHFLVHERLTLSSCHFTIRAPRRLRDLIAIKTRARFGNRELQARSPERWKNEDVRHGRVLARLALRPGWWPAIALYLLVRMEADRRAKARLNAGDCLRWERDESSRTLAPLTADHTRIDLPPRKPDIDVSILIVSYNTREYTLACLRSVMIEADDLKQQVIVVDNGSTDGSCEQIREQFPDVELIIAHANLGFAKGSNLAARSARGEFLLLLNPDTVVLDRAVGRIVEFARANPDAGLIGGRTLYADGSLNATSCFALPTLWGAFCRATGLSAVCPHSSLFNPEDIGGWDRSTLRDVGAITGCFALIPRSLWRSLGGLDQTFFMYSEDTDLSLRVQRAGFRCVHVPDATIIHHGGRSEKSRAGKINKVFKARSQYMRKHWHPLRAWLGENLLVACALSRMVGYASWRMFHRSAKDEHLCWRDVWRTRAQWRDRSALVVAYGQQSLGRIGQ